MHESLGQIVCVVLVGVHVFVRAYVCACMCL